MASAYCLGKSRGVDGPRVKRHGAIVYNKRRRSARGAGASELVVDEVRTASAVTMGKKEQGGGGGIEPKQEHDFLRWLVNLWAFCS